MGEVQGSLFSERLEEKDFNRLIEFIYTNYGINITASKKVMLEGRLYKRLRDNGLTTFKQYLDFLFSDEGRRKELHHMIDTVTTNKTDFFRENYHFEFITDTFLPQLPSGQSLKFWSAGCSTGEEPYTIAMVMEEYIRHSNKTINYSVLATDLSTRVLKQTKEAVYAEGRIEGIPLELKKKYFLKSKDRQHPTVRLVNSIRSKIKVAQVNFKDAEYPVHELFDVVFCRNVLIYFDKETQKSVLLRLCNKLKKGGLLFIGHSESITNYNLPVTQIKPTIFVKD